VINARLYFNGDDCFLCWATPPISNCWGFAIRRNLVTADGKHSDGLLHNYTGFKATTTSLTGTDRQTSGRFRGTRGPIMASASATPFRTRSLLSPRREPT